MRLYGELNNMGWPTGFKQCGSLLIARTRDRLTHLRRMKAHSTCRQIECHMLSNDEISRRYPYVNVSDIHGGLFLPEDGVADPDAICTSKTILITHFTIAHMLSTCVTYRSGSAGVAKRGPTLRTHSRSSRSHQSKSSGCC